MISKIGVALFGVLFVIGALTASPASAQKTVPFNATYEFTGNTACPATDNDVTIQPGFALFSSFKSSGVVCNSLNQDYTTSGWPVGAVLDSTLYVGFTVDATVGLLNFDSSDIFGFVSARNGNGPTNGAVIYSIDGGQTFQSMGIFLVGSIVAMPMPKITGAKTVEFRIYGWAATNSNGRMSLDNVTLNGAAELAGVQMTTGTYVGDGAVNRPITGVGFQPDLVIIKGDIIESAVARTSTMPPDAAKELGTNAALLNNVIVSLDIDGFTVGSDQRANNGGTSYYWVAFEAALGQMDVGSYSGNASDDRSITGVGFQPAYLIVMNESGQEAMQRFPTQAGDNSLPFLSSDPRPDRIQAFEPDGFQIGKHNTVNEPSVTLHYVAWSAIAGRTGGGLYVGDGNDNRSIPGAGFSPEYLIVARDAKGDPTVHRPISLTGDNTLNVDGGTTFPDGIQSMLVDGFQVGTDNRVNGSAELYHWMAFSSQPITDLEMFKTASDTTVAEGDTLSYVVAVTNNGPLAATGIVIADTLPAGMTFLASAPSQGTYTPLTGIWDTGDVSTGGSASLMIDVIVDPGMAGSVITNRASVLSSDQVDPTSNNDWAVASVRVLASDLALTKNVDDGTPSVNDTVNYTITLVNFGPTDANAVEVTDSLPAGVNFVAASVSQGTYDTLTGIWNVGTMSALQINSLSITVAVDPGALGQTLRNIASITGSDVTDPDSTNNRDIADITILAADLAVAQTVDNATPNEADTVVYSITISNPGPHDATSVELTDSLLTGLTYQWDLASQGGYNNVSGLWSVGTIAVGDSATLTIAATVDPGTAGLLISNTSAITNAAEGDPDFVNNSAATIIAVNAFPVVVSAIPDTAVVEDGGPVLDYRDLNDVFGDLEDGTALSFTVNSSDSVLVAATVDASDSTLDLSLGANQSGTATITVRATDSGTLFVEDQFDVAVTPDNDNPTVVSAMPDTTVAEDNPAIIAYRDLNDVFDDVEDGTALRFTVFDNNNPGLVSPILNVADSTLNFAFAPNMTGSATIVIRATDSGASSVDDTLLVTVTPDNDPPTVVSAMPDTTVAEDNPTITAFRDLNDVFNDIEDGTALNFSILNNDNPGLVSPTINVADSTLDLGFTTNANGSATIVIRAADSGALTVDDTLVVTVTSLNDPPTVVSAMPDTTVAEDNPAIAAYRDLNDVFNDVEDGAALSFGVFANSNPGLVTPLLNLADSTLNFGFTPNASGSATIVIRATDSGALSVDDTVVVTVTSVNDQPTVVSAIPDTTVVEDGGPVLDYRDLNDVFGDVEDGTALTFTVTSSDPTVVGASVDVSDSTLDLSLGANQSGAATITVRATDSGTLFVEDQFDVTVTPDNDNPTVVSAMPDTTVAEDNSTIIAFSDLNNVFDDIEDGTALDFTVFDNDNPGLVSPTINVADSTLDLGFTTNANGSATIVIRATDSGALTVDDTLVLTVSAVNDTPVTVIALQDTLVNENAPPVDNYVDLNNIFSDIEDGGALSFSITSNSNPALVTTVIDADSALDMSFAPASSGSATIIIRATDSFGLLAEDTMVVQVAPAARIMDVAGSLYPSTAFVGDPQLALRIGVDNASLTGVTLDITSSIYFSDGANSYQATLANPTFVPPSATNFTLTFAVAAIPGAMAAPASYDLRLALSGVDATSAAYTDTVWTTGRNSIFVDTPRIQISARPLDVENVIPGQRQRPILVLDVENGYSTDRVLDSLAVVNTSFGSGTPAQFDGEIEQVYLFDDVDTSGGFSPADTVVITSTFVANLGEFSVNGNWQVPATSTRTLIVVVDVDSTTARDGDQLDAALVDPADIVFQGSTLIVQDFYPLDPLDSFGRLVVDGMAAHQIAISPTALDTLDSGTSDNWLLTITLPQNGYDADALTALSIKNYAPDFDASDVAAWHLYRDTGNGVYDTGVDTPLGDLVHSGDLIEISGLNESVTGSITLFVTADISINPTTDNHIQLGIPIDGIDMFSNNDGPVDQLVSVMTSYTLRRIEKVDVSSMAIPGATPNPGDNDVALLLVKLENNTLQSLELDTLSLLNLSTGAGSPADLDNNFSDIQLVQDNGNGVVDPSDIVIRGGLGFSSGALTAVDLNIDLAPDETKYILVVTQVDSSCARDGDTLRIEVPAVSALGFDQAVWVNGPFPFATPVVLNINGMMAHQLAVTPTTDSLIVTGGTDVLVFDFGVPANGYAVDTLESIHLHNLGSATFEHFARLALYQDGGDGVFDAGTGDDVYVGDFSEDPIDPDQRRWDMTVSTALVATCGAVMDFYVAGDITSNYSSGGSVQMSIPTLGLAVASANDGPLDAAVANPSIQVIPKPDQLTIFPYSVGDQIVYPGSDKNLNFGIGFYNGYTFPLQLDELKVFQAGTASSTEIDSVFAYSDSDTNGLFDIAMDSLLTAVTSGGISYTLPNLALTLLPERISYVFIANDLSLTTRDSVTIDFKLFDVDGLKILPVDSDIQGEFPINSPGIDITDGMIAKQIVINPAPSLRAAPNDVNVLAMGMTIPANGILFDALDFVSIANQGTALPVTDIAGVFLWREAGGDPNQFDPVDDQVLASLNWNGLTWTNAVALGEPISLGGLKTYVTFSVANGPTDGSTFKAMVPINGIEVSSGNDGPIDRFVENPNQQSISTDPLITSLRTDRFTYSVGQPISLSMDVRNEGVDTLYGITPSLITVGGAGSVSLSSGPMPVSMDLPPGADSTIVWTYAALTAGDVDFCGFAQNQDTTFVSAATCSDFIEIENRATNIELSLQNSAPATANRGQDNITMARVTLNYNTLDSLAASAQIRSMTLRVEDNLGNPVPPNSILDLITFLSQSGTNEPFSVVDSTTNPLRLTPATPIVLMPGTSLDLDVTCGIADSAGFAPFHLSIAALADVNVVDANDTASVALTTSEIFPFQTTDVLINEAADSLLVTSSAGATVPVNMGQTAVQLMSLSLLNQGGPDTAGIIVTAVTLAFFDTTGANLAPQDVIQAIDIETGGQSLYSAPAVMGNGNELAITLTTPLVLSPGSPQTVDVLVDASLMPLAAGFYAELPSPLAVVARDINTTQIVSVSALDPVVMDFPFLSNEIVFEAPASGVVASNTNNLPPSILPGMSAIPVMDIILSHEDSTLSSSLDMDSLAVFFRTDAGAPMFPGDYFSSVYLVHAGDTLSQVTSLSSTLPMVECKLDTPIVIAPAATETLSVFLNPRALFQTATFEVWLDAQHIVLLDQNDGSRFFGITGSFPLVAGPSMLQLPSGLVLAGIESTIPQNVNPQETNISAFDLLLENVDPPGHTPATFKNLVLQMRGSNGGVLDPTQYLGAARLFAADTVVANAQINSGNVTFLVPAGIDIPSASTDTLGVEIDINTQKSDVNFHFSIADTSSMHICDSVTGDTLMVGTMGNTGYPLLSASTHILGSAVEDAFTNYPNPFAAGREDTRITYNLAQQSTVTLKLYTLWGTHVRTLLDAKTQAPGLYQNLTWSGQNDEGDTVNNGVYFLILEIRGSDGSQRKIRRKVGVVR